MASLTDFVDVAVSITAQNPAQATFAIPLIVGFHAKFPELVRAYSSIAGMEADGFTAEDTEYQVAQKFFAQSITVPVVKIGRLTGAQTVRVVTLLANPQNLGLYTISINGRSYSFTADASATAPEVATGLAAAINLDATIPVTATVSVNNLVLTADVAGPDFFVDIANEAMWASVQDSSAVRSTLSADLAAIFSADDSWYALALTRNNHLDAAVAAAFVQTRKRVFLATLINFGSLVPAQDNLAANTTNLAGMLRLGGFTRTFPHFTKHDAGFDAAGIAAVVLPEDVGSWTAHAKTAALVFPSKLSTTEQLNLETNRANHYQTVAGLNVSQRGMMSSARFFDEIVIVDWTTARIQEAVLGAMTFLKKIPFTEGGIAIIENAILSVLAQGVQQGAFVENTIYARGPSLDNVPDADKLARFLQGVVFGADLAGAIHRVSMRGNLAP